MTLKQTVFFLCCVSLPAMVFAQKPSKEQIEADKKKYAEAQKQLNEKLSKMSPEARREYDKLMNQMGMGAKTTDANTTVANASDATSKNTGRTGLMNGIPAKNTKKIAAIAATPSTAGMGAFINRINSGTFSAVLPAAKTKAAEIFKALQSSPGEAGNAAAMLWVSGKTQIALSLMAQICAADVSQTDNINNYASMLSMMGAPEMAIPVLNNLNARFKRNSTILNNLGQAWFALGDIDKANKYLDSTLLLAAHHPQANFTKCLIEESKGNKAKAIAYAKASFKQAFSREKADKLKQLGYTPTADDYNYPAPKKNDDLLNLGGFSMPPFPKSVAECIGLVPVWKQFRADIDQRMKPLQRMTEESNKAMMKQLEKQQARFMEAKNRAANNPGSVSQSEAMGIAAVPLYAEKVSIKEKIVLENLGKKKQAAVQRIAGFINGDGAAMRAKYKDAVKKVDDRVKEAERNSPSRTVDPAAFCNDYEKAADEFLNPYNTTLEGLYYEYLNAEKQLLNETAYSLLYTTYPELMPGVIAGLQMQWLRDLSLTQNGFNFENITKYNCTTPDDLKHGKLTNFKNPNCDINSKLQTPVGSITVDCGGITTQFNLGIVGTTFRQDSDHAGFGDSFESCTVSIGPKAGTKANLGPVQVTAEGSVGIDVEIDRNGVKDVIIKAGAEAGAGYGGGVGASAGIEGSISINSGHGSIGGTGIFK